MVISQGKEKDIQDIMNLIKKTVENMISEGLHQWNESYPNIDTIKNDVKMNCLYIIKDNDSLVGTITLNEDQAPEYKNLTWQCNNGKVLVIHRLAVDPLIQKKGFAKKLIAFTEDYAKNNKYTSIRVDTYSKNSKALSLYENLGYKKTGEVYFPRKTSPFICFEKIFF